MPEIQKADPEARRKALWLLSAATLTGAALLVAFESDLVHRWMELNLARPGMLLGALLLPLLPVAAAGLLMWRLGRRVVNAERFPPPGMAVVRDTAVRVKSNARRLGRLLQVLAVALLGVLVMLAAVAWRLSQLLGAATSG